MGRDGKPTRDKILAESKTLVFENGFSGTSIDQILEKTGITKGAFFYHFKTKNALAKALIDDFVREDVEIMNSALQKSASVDQDPLERLLLFVQEFIDMMSTLEEPPSCLYASYTYEPSQFSQEVLNMISDTILMWRTTLEGLIHDVLKVYQPKVEIDITSLADHLTVIYEGAFVLSKSLNEPDITAKQLIHLKNYFSLLFVKK